MTHPLILAISSMVTLLCIVALIREHRLRRALQRLLTRLISIWRNRRDPTEALDPLDARDVDRSEPHARNGLRK